jgi:hypothetical protein
MHYTVRMELGFVAITTKAYHDTTKSLIYHEILLDFAMDCSGLQYFAILA